MARVVGWLRGVNVGGRKLLMTDLRRAVEAVGATDVETYIQSGNVVFTAEPAPDLAARLQASLAEISGVDTAFVLRSRDELAAAVDGYPWPEADEDHRHLVFYAEEPRFVDELDPGAWLPERFARIGRDLYLWTPDGFGRMRMTPLLATRKGRPTGTTRNWRTCRKLLEMCS